MSDDFTTDENRVSEALSFSAVSPGEWVECFLGLLLIFGLLRFAGVLAASAAVVMLLGCAAAALFGARETGWEDVGSSGGGGDRGDRGYDNNKEDKS